MKAIYRTKYIPSLRSVRRHSSRVRLRSMGHILDGCYEHSKLTLDFMILNIFYKIVNWQISILFTSNDNSFILTLQIREAKI